MRSVKNNIAIIYILARNNLNVARIYIALLSSIINVVSSSTIYSFVMA